MGKGAGRKPWPPPWISPKRRPVGTLRRHVVPPPGDPNWSIMGLAGVPKAAGTSRHSNMSRDAFPTVQQLRLELKFEGAAPNIPAAQSHVLHPPAQAFFAFPCPHADCDGQFDLTAAANAVLTNQAVPAHQTIAEAEGALKCSGQRLDRRASRGPCQLHAHD